MTTLIFVIFPLAWFALPALLWHRVPWRRQPPRPAGRLYFLLRDSALTLAILSIPAMVGLTEVPGPRWLLPLWVAVAPMVTGWLTLRPRNPVTEGGDGA